MGPSHRQALAERQTACLICNVWRDEMISLAEHGAVICRPCTVTVSRTVLRMSPSIVARLWPNKAADSAVPSQSSRDAVNVDEVFATFKARVEESPVRAEDSQTHLDLAQAYGEMGLMADAVREAAIALGERSPISVATKALNWLLAPRRASPEALRMIAASSREG